MDGKRAERKELLKADRLENVEVVSKELESAQKKDAKLVEELDIV